MGGVNWRLEEKICPWCGRKMFSFGDGMECWECGVRWDKGVVSVTWDSVEVAGLMTADVVPVPEGDLVVRREVEA